VAIIPNFDNSLSLEREKKIIDKLESEIDDRLQRYMRNENYTPIPSSGD
jgi:hypothetical protein